MSYALRLPRLLAMAGAFNPWQHGRKVLVGGLIAAGTIGAYHYGPWTHSTVTASNPNPPNTMYVTAAGGGTKDGSSWTNACQGFSGSCADASLIRGDTYYVAAGQISSGTLIFDTATSGTQTITIKGATAADHGTSTGWLSSYAVGTASQQAHFAYTVAFRSSYWVFDGSLSCGVTGGSTCATASTYGFTIDQPSPCNQAQSFWQTDTGTITNNTVAHVAVTACPDDVQKVGFESGTQITASNNTYSHLYCSGFQNCIEIQGTSGTPITGDVIQNVYAVNSSSTAGHHGEVFDIKRALGITIRNNYFADCAGTGCIVSPVCSTYGINGGDIYGNVFANYTVGNGGIAPVSGCYMTNMNVYNNTFYNGSGGKWFEGCVAGNATQCAAATGNVAENNLICSMDADTGTSSGVTTDDYNSFFSTTNAPTETHGQTSASACPVTNTGTGDFHLASDTSAWNSSGIPSGDTLDPDGITRTSSRGAFQYR